MATDFYQSVSDKKGVILEAFHPANVFRFNGRDCFFQLLDQHEPRLFIREFGNTLVDLFDRGSLQGFGRRWRRCLFLYPCPLNDRNGGNEQADPNKGEHCDPKSAAIR